MSEPPTPAMPSAKVLDFNAAFTARELETYLESDEFDPQRRDKVLAGLKSSAESFVAWLFPAAVFTPRNARVGNIHGSPGSSLVIETHGSKRGLWKDFADPDQKGGNLIDLYMAAKGIPFRAALDELAEWVGGGTRPEIRYSREQLVRKAKRVERDLGPQKGEWHYTDAEGTIIASVYRFEPDDGGKEFLPWDAVRRRWGNPDVRPLYNIPGVLAASQIVVCEGEKAAEALIKQGVAATAVMGGSNSPLDRTDLEPLRGKGLIIWPDADEPGRKFALGFAQAVQGIADSVRIIEPPEGTEEGWDAADAVSACEDISTILGVAVAPAEAKPTLPFFWFDEAAPNLTADDFIEGLLSSAAMSVVYGPSNCGKTFFVLDLAMHVAWGREWRGRAIDQGAVVYLSLEGSAGIRNRISAFRKHHKLDKQHLPFVAMPQPIDLLENAADVAAVIQLIEYVALHKNLPVRMVIIDTLSRAMAGGDESSSKDMTALIRNCDRIRSTTGAHVCIVHHSGKDEAKGARGHSSLRAATDTEIEIKRDPDLTRSTVRVTKQRDLEAGDPFGFSLKPVALGTNRRNKDVTSCIVLEVDETVVIARNANQLSGKEEQALYCLIETLDHRGVDSEPDRNGVVSVDVSLSDWKVRLQATETINRNNADAARVQFNRLHKALENKGKIITRGDRVCLAETSET